MLCVTLGSPSPLWASNPCSGMVELEEREDLRHHPSPFGSCLTLLVNTLGVHAKASICVCHILQLQYTLLVGGGGARGQLTSPGHPQYHMRFVIYTVGTQLRSAD